MAGGKRPGSGRKPMAEAPSHDSNANKEARREAIEKLATTGYLSCPKYLTDEARREWRRVMRLYRQMGANILCDLDIAALVMYCEAWAIYRKAQEDWSKLKQTATTNSAAQALIDKTIETMNKQAGVVSKLSEQLCLTPVGRARMGINPTKSKAGDRILDFINGE